MSEAEWLACDDLTPMLIYLRGEIEPPEKEPDPRARLITSFGPLVSGESKRVNQQRLAWLAYECCKKWWELPLDEMSRRLVVSYERFLTGDGSWQEFGSACSQVWDAPTTGERPLINTMCQWSLTPYGMANLEEDLAWVTACHVHRERIEELERTASEDDRFAWGFFGYDFPEFGATAWEVRRSFPSTLREVVGNPFCPVSVDRSWLTPAVTGLARAIHADGSFDLMPVLADALEDAGCENGELLGHLRGQGPHLVGCWALDLVLGKE